MILFYQICAARGYPEPPLHAHGFTRIRNKTTYAGTPRDGITRFNRWLLGL